MLPEPTCSNPFCLFCAMKEPQPTVRRARIAQCFKQMPLEDDQELVLVLCGLWNIAMTQPDDPEFPSLGIFDCMAKLILRGVKDKEWLLRDQNIYIPYYAAHIIGSYTMNKAHLAEKAVKSGVVLPLLELLRGKISWVEQRVAARALGHLASHDRAFEVFAEHEVEIVELIMEIASSCLKTVYRRFLAVKDSKRIKYHCNLLTRGLGGSDMENRKAEQWANQLQSWSLYLLNSFACRGRSLSIICNKHFLKDLCGMWGGLVNTNSPGGLGLIRTLCKYKTGRDTVANLDEVIERLSNLSRSSDDWQHVAIDCLLLLLKDNDTRYKVIETAALSLVDLIELRSLNERTKVGEEITRTLLQDYHKIRYGDLSLKSQQAERALRETWDLKVDRKKKEWLMSEEELEERKQMVGTLKQKGNEKFWSGQIENAVQEYTKALDLCPSKMRQERKVILSNRAQCYLVMRNADAAISDTTRALSLSGAKNPHCKSLWRRAQAYDMKGLARESLMDCLKFITVHMKSRKNKQARIPYYATRMFNKQLNATRLFPAAVSSQKRSTHRRRHREDILIMKEIKERGVPDMLTAQGTFKVREASSEREAKRRKERKAKRTRVAPNIVAESARNRIGWEGDHTLCYHHLGIRLRQPCIV